MIAAGLCRRSEHEQRANVHHVHRLRSLRCRPPAVNESYRAGRLLFQQLWRQRRARRHQGGARPRHGPSRMFCVLKCVPRVGSSRTGEPHCGSHCHDRTAAPPLSIALPLRHCSCNTPPLLAQACQRAGAVRRRATPPPSSYPIIVALALSEPLVTRTAVVVCMVAVDIQWF